jgi:hypothetical protein
MSPAVSILIVERLLWLTFSRPNCPFRADGFPVLSGESISLQIPFNEAVDPKTKKTWEAVGVQPDLPVPAGQALAVAVQEAAKALLNGHPGQDRKFMLEWIKIRVCFLAVPAERPSL